MLLPEYCCTTGLVRNDVKHAQIPSNCSLVLTICDGIGNDQEKSKLGCRLPATHGSASNSLGQPLTAVLKNNKSRFSRIFYCLQVSSMLHALTLFKCVGPERLSLPRRSTSRSTKPPVALTEDYEAS
jgi:hypothetical protein